MEINKIINGSTNYKTGNTFEEIEIYFKEEYKIYKVLNEEIIELSTRQKRKWSDKTIVKPKYYKHSFGPNVEIIIETKGQYRLIIKELI